MVVPESEIMVDLDISCTMAFPLYFERSLKTIEALGNPKLNI